MIRNNISKIIQRISFNESRLCVKMEDEISIIQEKRDFRKLISALEVLHLSNDFNLADDSQNEVFDIKTIVRIQSSKAEAEGNLFNNRDSTYSKIRKINISDCGLVQVPHIIFSLKYLSVLNLSNNFLEDLPKELGNLCNLLTLKLCGNKLKCLPKSLKNIQQLNFLDLSHNNFSEVPDVLYYGLRAIAILDLSCNEISKFNDPPGCLSKLVALSLSDNFLKHLPTWIFDNHCQLQFLDVSQNQFSLDTNLVKFSQTGIYKSLELLSMENCNLNCKKLEIFSFFKKLKFLHLGNGKMTNKKENGKNYMGNLNLDVFINFQEITDLHLQSVQIATLPTDFNVFKNIEVLDLSDNLLSWLPESFCDLTNLKILHLTSNQLLFLPTNFGNLANLKQVHLGNNKLCRIPESFYNLKNLEFVDFYNNEIERIDPRIFKEKHLKGIDLGLNCFLFGFGFCENNIGSDEIKMLYDCLRESFRKHFCYTDRRCDLQVTKSDKGVNEAGSDSHSYSNHYSTSSFESEPSSDLDDSFQNIAQQNQHNEEDDWDLHQAEEDELFDPNKMDLSQRPQNLWRSDFQNNYCPANYHVQSVMNAFINNFRSALKNETVEEGQFDSD